MKTINDMKIGEECKVTEILGEGALKRRIMDMGITKGVAVKLVKVAPLGDPLQLDLRGYALSIRKSEAQNVKVG